MEIYISRVRNHGDVMRTIIRHTPTLDPIAIILNSELFYIRDDGRIVSFATYKRYGNARELGTVYTHPEYRGRGYAQHIIQSITSLHADRPLYVLCEPRLQSLYESCGFVPCTRCTATIRWRRTLFNAILAPLTRYPIVSLRYQVVERHRYFTTP